MATTLPQIPPPLRPIEPLLTALGIPRYRQDLQVLPAQIEAAQASARQKWGALRSLRRDVAQAKEELDTADAVLVITIAEEKTHKNEAARKAELLRRRKSDETYQGALAQFRQAEDLLATAEGEAKAEDAKVDQLLRRYQTLLALLASSTAALEAAVAHKGV